ncbi:MAG: hypothetical protein ACJ74Z_17630 [Bryobacteraceae bacterium]
MRVYFGEVQQSERIAIPSRLIGVTSDAYRSGTLQIQPVPGTGERRNLPIVFQTFASKCLTLSTTEALGLSTAVGVEYNDVLFVGEVVRCTAGVRDQWQLEIKVAQTLSGLQSLLMLRAELQRHQSETKDADGITHPLCSSEYAQQQSG